MLLVEAEAGHWSAEQDDDGCGTSHLRYVYIHPHSPGKSGRRWTQLGGNPLEEDDQDRAVPLYFVLQGVCYERVRRSGLLRRLCSENKLQPPRPMLVWTGFLKVLITLCKWGMNAIRGFLILRIAIRTSCMVFFFFIQHGLIPTTIHTTEMRVDDSTETLESLLRRTAWDDLRPLQIRGIWHSKQMMWDVVDETAGGYHQNTDRQNFSSAVADQLNWAEGAPAIVNLIVEEPKGGRHLLE